MREPVSENNQITRRSFCNTVLLASSALALHATNAAAATNTRAQVVEYPPLKIEGAEQLLPGSFIYFNYPTHKDEAVLLKTPDGEYCAYSRKCAHLGCSVNFNGARRCLICPCHQGVYDMKSGLAIFGPPQRPLDGIVLQMRAGGSVWAVGKTIIPTDRDA